MTQVTIARLADLTDGEATRIDVDDRRLAVIRIGDSVYVIGDTCTHQDISLAEGEVDPDTLHIECWKHGSSFSIETGEPDVLPATRATPTYDVVVVDGDVRVTLPEECGS